MRASLPGVWEPQSNNHPPKEPHLGQEGAGSSLCHVTHWLGASAEHRRGEDAAVEAVPLTTLLVSFVLEGDVNGTAPRLPQMGSRANPSPDHPKGAPVPVS